LSKTTKTLAKGHPKTRKIANFDNIKAKVNEMKTSSMQKNELINLKLGNNYPLVCDLRLLVLI
jgi:hypothetical protein